MQVFFEIFLYLFLYNFVLTNIRGLVYYMASAVIQPYDNLKIYNMLPERRQYLEFKNNIPIYYQVVTEIKNMIVSGMIKPGDKLPSSRELALRYRINPNTAARVYSELEHEGITETQRGIGTFVKYDPYIVQKIGNDQVNRIVAEFIVSIRNMGYNNEEIKQMISNYLENEKR